MIEQRPASFLSRNFVALGATKATLVISQFLAAFFSARFSLVQRKPPSLFLSFWPLFSQRASACDASLIRWPQIDARISSFPPRARAETLQSFAFVCLRSFACVRLPACTPNPIAIEDAKGPYANLIAVRSADKDKPWVSTLVKAFQPPEVKALVESRFAGSMVPAF